MWYHFEWQSRTSIHAHGVVKLKHYPDLLTKVYIGLLMVHNLADPQYTADLSEQDVLERQTLIDDGIFSEHKVLKYTDTLLSAVNTRSDLANPFNAEVPVSNPCPTNVSSIPNDGVAMDDYYESLANCVQLYVCGPAGYCKSKNGGTECLFNFLFI
jgi:hypothetical protein